MRLMIAKEVRINGWTMIITKVRNWPCVLHSAFFGLHIYDFDNFTMTEGGIRPKSGDKWREWAALLSRVSDRYNATLSTILETLVH